MSISLEPGFKVLAHVLQEASMMHGDVRSRLSSAITAAHPDSYAYYVDHSGDGAEGSVVYSHNGSLKQASYSLGKEDGKATASVKTGSAKNVVPSVSYCPVAEAEVKESAVDPAPLNLVESRDWKEDALALVESSGNPVRMKIKLMAPGAGSSAFYPAEALKTSGPKVFTKGTHVYINHATDAEEAARPEGDWHKLAGALDENAYYSETEKQGPGLYSHALFTSDYAPLIKEKAAFTGMSIRAGGIAEAGAKKNGLPILKEFTHATSVDIVTRAGAGGMVLTEAAKPQSQQEAAQMTADEAKALIATAVSDAVAPLKARTMQADAKDEARELLSSIELPEAAKTRIINESIREIPVKDGALDIAAFRESVVRIAKAEGEYVAGLTGSGRVAGLGTAAAIKAVEAVKPEEMEAAAVKDFMAMGMSESKAKLAVKGRAA